MFRKLIFLLSTLLLLAVHAAPVYNVHPHRVIHLPGAPLLPEFPLYSGFLKGSSDGNSQMFYVLCEAIRVDPTTAPLVIWFQGGPGVSSLHGLFTENGPYRVTEEGNVLTFNEFSWNQYANMLYLESPLGVGFSRNDDGNLTMEDVSTAELNFNTIKDFLTRVHPRYVSREFYLSGQSYAGVLVPFLARRLIIGISKGELANANFKGFAIGNPVIEGAASVLGE
ncbi:hypothetical protein PFISCL1PPCAC_5159, partial [Pristionchus fissidentatus]